MKHCVSVELHGCGEAVAANAVEGTSMPRVSVIRMPTATKRPGICRTVARSFILKFPPLQNNMFKLKLDMNWLSNQSGLLPIILGRGRVATVNIISRTIELAQDTLHLLIGALEITIGIVTIGMSRLLGLVL